MVESFRDLKVYQEAKELSLRVYKFTEFFPSIEKFGLTGQLRRASVSVMSNIAEGFGRSSLADKMHFYQISYGSLNEIDAQLELAKDLDFIKLPDYQSCLTQLVITRKMLARFIQSNRILKPETRNLKPGHHV